MAALVKVREPLVPLYPLNSKDLVRQSPSSGKMSQRPKVMRKSASLGASGAMPTAEAETMVESLFSRVAPEPIAENPKPEKEISQWPTRSREEQGESGNTSLSMGMRDNHHDDGVPMPGGEEESKSLMQLKMEAMTWAAMAKDYTISSLERRLRQALEIAKAEQERTQELERLLRESREREAVVELQLKDAKGQIGKLVEAEERLCVQLGDLEAEAVEEDRRYRSQIATLTARMETQAQYIVEALKPLKVGQSSTQRSGSPSYGRTGEYQPLSEKLNRAKEDIGALEVELRDTKNELRVAEGDRKRQSRKLKVLEKERSYLMRKGAIRSIRLAPRTHRKSDTETPGGEGWKVFSVLDFQA